MNHSDSKVHRASKPGRAQTNAKCGWRTKLIHLITHSFAIHAPTSRRAPCSALACLLVMFSAQPTKLGLLPRTRWIPSYRGNFFCVVSRLARNFGWITGLATLSQRRKQKTICYGSTRWKFACGLDYIDCSTRPGCWWQRTVRHGKWKSKVPTATR